MSNDLIMIKDKYGEKMMHYCRKNFSTILEIDGLLFSLLSNHFCYSRFLYDDIVNNSMGDMFKNYIYSLLSSSEGQLPVVSESTTQLLDNAGYVLYQCFSEDDIQSYRKYYASDEELCSFRGGRLDDCYVFFAVKKDVDQIKREDFINPMRQDKYGTSVISIQFTRGDVNTLSIKNRYNHKVVNPDATYSNNLENIIPGLTKSFERDYNLNINQNIYGSFELPGYVLAKDGKYYKYNYEINNIYYCVDNIIIDNFEVIRDYQEKEKYLIIDYFIIDLVNKKIILYDNKIDDYFIELFNDIRKIDIVRDKDTLNKKLSFTFVDDNKSYIEIDKYNRMISYSDDNVYNVGNNFLYHNIYLEHIDLPNITSINNYFMVYNKYIKEIYFDNLISIGSGFLNNNELINNVKLKNVIYIGDYFLSENVGLKEIEFLNLESVGDDFLEKNKNISTIYLPNLESIGDNFIRYNNMLIKIDLPNVLSVGSNFLAANKIIDVICMDSLIYVGNNFLFSNLVIDNLNLLNLKSVGNNFMYCNRCLKDVSLPILSTVGMSFLYKNNSIEMLVLPELIKTGRYFMHDNNSLKRLFVPKLEKVDVGFLFDNDVLEEVCYDIEKLNRYFDVGVKKRILKR